MGAVAGIHPLTLNYLHRRDNAKGLRITGILLDNFTQVHISDWLSCFNGGVISNSVSNDFIRKFATQSKAKLVSYDILFDGADSYLQCLGINIKCLHTIDIDDKIIGVPTKVLAFTKKNYFTGLISRLNLGVNTGVYESLLGTPVCYQNVFSSVVFLNINNRNIAYLPYRFIPVLQKGTVVTSQNGFEFNNMREAYLLTTDKCRHIQAFLGTSLSVDVKNGVITLSVGVLRDAKYHFTVQNFNPSVFEWVTIKDERLVNILGVKQR